VKISVLIPVRNEELSIRALLESLRNQTLKPAEVVITDGGSSDATPEIISEFVKRGDPIHLLREAAALPGRGRNLAAAQAANEWLAFIDAGITPEPNWLESLGQRAQTQIDGEDVDVVYGTYEPVTDSLFKLCAVMAYVAPPYEVDGRLIRPCSVASALMKRSVWRQVGGFPENLRSAEDLLFMRKIEGAGFKIARAPEALVHWQVEATAWRTFKRFIGYARNNMRAGLWSEWQAPLFRRYGWLFLSALPAVILGVKWLLVPLILWLVLLSARALVALKRNRVRYPGTVIENVLRFTVLTPLIAMLDVATIIGTLQWAASDKSEQT
jgi:glycosyltransferase involved in cell wall biosynthesis